ncbi:alpha/beta fold hydrolase [Streptomyces sp. NPDC087294]|uniref:alpha/beta fold hydrolase n=1 Tax=Streptomyces sp. NPDC087294 TaxID=3365777 RepID=UPI00382F9C4B
MGDIGGRGRRGGRGDTGDRGEERMPAGSSGPSRRALVGRGALAALAVTGVGAGQASAADDGAGRGGVEGPAVPWEPVPVPEQVPVTEHRVPVAGGGSLWCWDTGGNGEPVVLLHPGSGSGESWPYQQPVLARAGFRTIGYSRRGAHGSVAGDPARADTVSGDLHTLADQLGLDRFHLAASAAGGQVAVDHALSHPERLRSLTVSGSIMGISDADYTRLSASLRPAGFSQLPVEFQELGPSYRGGDPAGVAAWLAIHARARTDDAFSQTFAHTITWAALETLALPVQLITGDADLYSPPSVKRLIARHLRDVETHVITEAGHNPHWEQPAAWNHTLLTFLNQH